MNLWKTVPGGRTRLIQIRVSEEERQYIADRAQADGVTVSEFLRGMALATKEADDA